MPASQDMYAAQSLDMDANVDATDLLLEYARSMHMHTKRQMDSNSSPVAPASRLANASAAPVPGRSNTSSSTSSETDDQPRA